jgi:predicted ABC-class ATPase
VDEDTSATNFMIRDHRMQELVEKRNEPITPFIDKVRQLKEQLSVSTILVMGGSGDYFDVADTVIMMESYRPKDVTKTALNIAAKYAAERKKEGGQTFGNLPSRILKGESLNPRRGKREARAEPRGQHTILFGNSIIDLSGLEQLVEEAQTRAIGLALLHLKDHYLAADRPLKAVLDDLEKELTSKGLDLLSLHKPGNLAWPRKLEIGAAISRLRGLRVA